jgi:hypothetical protein
VKKASAPRRQIRSAHAAVKKGEGRIVEVLKYLALPALPPPGEIVKENVAGP